jgi:MerC mercury resistance protein
LITPVLPSLSAVAAHFPPAEESVHRSLALLVALFGAIALILGFRKHRRVTVLLMMFSGLHRRSRPVGGEMVLVSAPNAVCVAGSPRRQTG